ncbi:MAG: large conductance mechanosensitive channel protein MscL [Bacilli bacterium]
MKKLTKEFISFISKGNVIDLAVAFMLGAAFQKIVSSLVNYVLMPLVGWLVQTDLSQWYLTLQEGVATVESEQGLSNPPSGWVEVPIRLQFGLFIQSLIDFLMIAVLLFAVIKFFELTKRLRLKVEGKFSQSTKKTAK